MSSQNYEKALNQAFKILGRRARSVSDLRARLLKKNGDNAEIVDRVINRLRELGYLNDDDFAVNYANNRLTAKPLGRARLRAALIRKQVKSEVADRALDQIFEQQEEKDLCQLALDRYLRIHGRPQDAKESKKLLAHLIRLGFPYSMVIDKIRKIAALDDLDEDLFDPS